MINKDVFIKQINIKIEGVLLLINTEMLMDGDTEETSQRCYLVNRIRDFEHAVNGVQNSDMKSFLTD